MEQVVDPLGETEKSGSPSIQQAGRPGSAAVGHERAEQLGDSASARRRVDVPDDAAFEVLARPGRGLLHSLPLLFVQHHAELLERGDAELHLVQPGWVAVLMA